MSPFSLASFVLASLAFRPFENRNWDSTSVFKLLIHCPIYKASLSIIQIFPAFFLPGCSAATYPPFGFGIFLVRKAVSGNKISQMQTGRIFGGNNTGLSRQAGRA